MSNVPLLDKNRVSVPISPIRNSPKNTDNFWTVLENRQKNSPIQSQIYKTKTAEEFMSSLQEDTTKERFRIEKDMKYLTKTFEDCGFIVEFQDNYIQEIDKSLKEAEENSKKVVETLKKAKDKIGCYQSILNSIIVALIIVIILLSILAYFVG
ncbi:hypothetical protein SteCoe_28880 [Stentor coeruleus]|uniref:t-SNARE coiled-coil homology domain-containing protein n=1 Tax=Stentor coeruleus TaxID=5963 RepID=A0A1R2AW20_9CILI|nr:hypothetical protein SteCoe_33714 [Stentor coeruleus]OMJ72626.1 hypothetical protein SteCoe_28880 [Stentor coeruleus]